MTHDKMDKHIRTNMLDDFLSDEDKPAPPKPTYPSRDYSRDSGSGWQDGFDFSRGDSARFADDDGPDPMDKDYKVPPRVYRPPAQQSVFANPASHSVGQGESGMKLEKIINRGSYLNGEVMLTPGQVDEIVAIYVKEIGLLNDKAGLCWSTEGLKYLKASIRDLVNELYYGSSKVLEVDDVTGKVGR